MADHHFASNPAPRPDSGPGSDPEPTSADRPRPGSSPANSPTQPEAPASIPFGMPREIGPFQIQRVIGSGGMATVYAALQKQPRRTVALKVMRAGMAEARGEAALRRFKREIEILGKLHHPYIAQVYDAGAFDDPASPDGGPTPYFVMEYIPGATTILEYISRKELNLRDRLKLFVKVCAAVEHGHKNKVIHRDLKPGNILIDQYGEPKIIDFGIAHAAELDISQQTMQTEAGRLVGTLQYMAPEQVDTRPQDLDGRCDVYALGVLLYKMVTGKPPYDLEALPVYEAVRIIREERPRRPSEVNPEVKGDLETIILKAMEHERVRRYRNAGSLGRDVVRFLANKPINARRAGLLYRGGLFLKRHAVVASVVGVIAIVAAAAIGYGAWERRRARDTAATQASSLSQRERELQRQREEIDARAAAAASQQPAVPRDEPFALQEHTGRIARLAFSADAATLVSASADHSVLRWDLAERTVQHRFGDLGGPIERLAASRDGRVLAAATGRQRDGITLLHAAAAADAGDAREATLRDLGGNVTAIALSRDAGAIAWGDDTLALNIAPLDPQTLGTTRNQTQRLRSSSGPFTAIAFDGPGGTVAAGTEGGTIAVWNVGVGSSPPQRLPGLRSGVLAVALVQRDDDDGKPPPASSAARQLIAIAQDGSGMIWSESAGGSWSGVPLRLSEREIIAAAFSPDARHLAIVTLEGVAAWNVQAGAAEALVRAGQPFAPGETPNAVAIDDAGRWVALGMLNGDVRVEPVNR